MLDCGSASIFERYKGRCKVRGMFLGPLNLEPSIAVMFAHNKREYSGRRS
jgi:hypothetical protein